jgi:hypothetical protein
MLLKIFSGSAYMSQPHDQMSWLLFLLWLITWTINISFFNFGLSNKHILRIDLNIKG